MKLNANITLLFASLSVVCFSGSQASAQSLVGSVTQISPATLEYAASVDLTAEGTADWIFWGENHATPTGAFDHKAAGPETNSISDLSVYGGIGPYYDADGGQNFSWSDGTPDATGTDTNNCFANGPAGNGLQFTVKADTRTKYLKVYFGGYDGIVACTATLSDGSAPPIALTVDDSGDYQAEDYATIQFAAGSTNQMLTVAVYISVTGVTDAGYTTVGLSAATLQIPPPAPSISVHPGSQTNYLTLAAQFNVVAAGGFPLSYQWLEESNGAFVPLSDGGQISGSTNSTLTISNLVSANATIYEVVVSNNWGSVSSLASLTIVPQTGVLIASSAAAPAAVYLTAEGELDWASWGYPSGAGTNYFEQKVGVTEDISDVATFGDPTSGPTQNSFAPQAASWSDGTPDLAVTNSTTGIYWGGANNGFQFSVAASTNAQILKVYVDAYSSKLHFEATLSDSSAPAYVDESITTLAYDDESIVYTIEFQAGSPGQTLNILAYSLLDNGGGGNTELMSATLRGPEPYVESQSSSTTNWVTQTAELTVSAEGWMPLNYQWWMESNGVYAPLADAGQISGSKTAALAISNLVFANATNYYVVITNGYGAVTSSVVALTILPITGVLSGTAIPAPATADLTAAGTLDWAAWGELSGIAPNYLEQKAGGSNQISDVTVIGAGSGPNQFANALVACSWSDGTPDASESGETMGIYFNGLNDGYQITVPADTTKKVLTVYAGGYGATVNFQAALSDQSAPPYVNGSLVDPGGSSSGAADAYKIEFAAGTNNQTLTVTVTCATGGGNCTLIAATLADPAPLIVDQPASQTNNVTTTAQFTVSAQGGGTLNYEWLVDANGVYIPLSDGGQISGSGTPTLTISNLVLANATNYQVLVSNISGAVTSSVATLTVLPITGTLSGSSQYPLTTQEYNLTAEGTLDWAVWGYDGTGNDNGTAFDQKSEGGLNPIMNDLTGFGPAPNGPNGFDNGGAPPGWSWTDGTISAGATNEDFGVYFNGNGVPLGNGYTFSVQASTNVEVLRVYAGVYDNTLSFKASFSDGSAPPYVDQGFVESFGGAGVGLYKIEFASITPGALLNVTATCGTVSPGDGNVTLYAASLALAGAPPVTLQLDPATLKLTWSQGTLLQATNLLGPWTTNSSPSPFTITPSSGPQMFYKVLVQ